MGRCNRGVAKVLSTEGANALGARECAGLGNRSHAHQRVDCRKSASKCSCQPRAFEQRKRFFQSITRHETQRAISHILGAC